VKRQRITRLGSGEYERADGSASVSAARGRLLDAVVKLKPEIMDSLCDRPLTIFRTLVRIDDSVTFGIPQSLESDPELEPLRKALLAWSDKCGLTEPWCCRWAAFKLLCYPRLQELTRTTPELPNALPLLGYHPRVFTFEIRDWQPTGQTRTDYEGQAREAF
jgi:hypothetical protein